MKLKKEELKANEFMGNPTETPVQNGDDEAKESEAAVRGGIHGEDHELSEGLRGKVAAGALLLTMVALMLVVLSSGSPGRKDASARMRGAAMGSATPANEKSSLPITKTAQTAATPQGGSLVHSSELEGTAKHAKQESNVSAYANGTLGQVTPFNSDGDWRPTAYQAGGDAGNVSVGESLTIPADGRTVQDALEKPSLVFVRSREKTTETGTTSGLISSVGLNLPTGTKLRAHLETVATTAVAMPVLAVIDYDYMRNGEILVPAGAKAVGKVEQADRTGYISIRFESLLLPDGSSLEIQGAAADLSMRPLKGKVEGSHSGRNILIRSLSGIGQVGSMLIGGNANKALSESDLMKQQVASNIGEVSDQEIARSTVTERVVVSVPANTSLYVVLQRSQKPVEGRRSSKAQGSGQSSAEQLQQLMELNQELNRQETAAQAPEQR